MSETLQQVKQGDLAQRGKITKNFIGNSDTPMFHPMIPMPMFF